VSRLLNAFLFEVEEEEGGGGSGEQGIGPDFIEPGVMYSQPTGNSVDFTEEG